MYGNALADVNLSMAPPMWMKLFSIQEIA